MSHAKTAIYVLVCNRDFWTVTSVSVPEWELLACFSFGDDGGVTVEAGDPAVIDDSTVFIVPLRDLSVVAHFSVCSLRAAHSTSTVKTFAWLEDMVK